MTASKIEPKGSAKRYEWKGSRGEIMYADCDCGVFDLDTNASLRSIGEELVRLATDHESLERELAALKGASRMTEERAREIAVDSLKSAAPFGGQFYGLVVDAILAACREDSAALADENIEQAKQIVVLCNDLEYLGGIIERGGGTLDQDAPLTGQITGYVGNLEREPAALVERNKALMAAAKFGLACVDAGHVCVNSEAVAAARAAVEEG